ncbi:MAG: hypothetical protein DWQ37_09595 [Planctomycetota bacterium]|nr:MAG: hypothetical protein DWQ37_09595 [Planctomycetota bacterium]
MPPARIKLPVPKPSSVQKTSPLRGSKARKRATPMSCRPSMPYITPPVSMQVVYWLDITSSLSHSTVTSSALILAQRAPTP